MESIAYLKQQAYHIRRLSLMSTTQAGSGHPTSCLSAADLLSVLFFDTLKPEDFFILSKGHAAPALYAAYALLGCIPKDELLTLRHFNSRLEGHPTPRFPYTPLATGSLGQGLSDAVGVLLAQRLKKSASRCYVLMGDSETTEGSVWEAAELAHYYNLSNMVALIDVNGLGQTTRTIDSLQTYQKKFESFGWNALIIEGNNCADIQKTLQSLTFEKPTCIIAHTLKGYGVPSLQDKDNLHGKVCSREELPGILEELKNAFPESAGADQAPLKNSTLCRPWHKTTPPAVSLPTSDFKKEELIATRKAYGIALKELGRVSPDVVCLDAEVNNSTYASIFAEAFPERFFQSFIAEQNMIGMATGLAVQGFIPFASTFAAFTTRAYDQLRMAAISEAPVRVVGSHAGVSIGQDGPSQMGLEDIALFSTLPDSLILYPCDAVSTYRCVELMANYSQSISYLRTTRSETAVIYDNTTSFTIGGCHVVKESPRDTITLLGAGVTLFEALKAADMLAKEGIEATVIDCYSIKPLPIETIVQCAEKTNYRLITCEDHYLYGGLGQMIAAACTRYACHKPWNIVNLAVTQLPRSGKAEELRTYERIDAQSIYETARKMMSFKKKEMFL